MKPVAWIVLIVAGLVVVVALAIGGGAYWFAHAKVNFGDPNFTAQFKDGFDRSCMTNFQKGLDKRSIVPTDAQRVSMQNMCDCAGSGVVEIAQKRGGMTAAEITAAIKDDPEFKTLTRNCAAQNGITMP
jgi:hypothetical protein